MADITKENRGVDLFDRSFGVFGFDVGSLPWRTRFDLDQDPSYRKGVITYSDFPISSARHLIITNPFQSMLTRGIVQICGETNSQIEIEQGDYSILKREFRAV